MFQYMPIPTGQFEVPENFPEPVSVACCTLKSEARDTGVLDRAYHHSKKCCCRPQLMGHLEGCERTVRISNWT